METVTVDAGYKTPWICKKVFDVGRNISTPYKRPMTGKSCEYVYDEYYDCVICSENQVLLLRHPTLENLLEEFTFKLALHQEVLRFRALPEREFFSRSVSNPWGTE